MFLRRAALCLLLASSTLAAQETIQVTGAVKQPLTLTAEELAKMPRASVTTVNNGMQTVYEGVWIHEVLKRAGVPQGEALRGKELTSYVLAEAQDGYQVIFSLDELDPVFVDSQVLIADTANGKPLSPTQGPFRLVVPKDKHGSRSIRMLSRLEVVQVRK
jgi:DMSO/TMAO reductase YedYZ molybdopterin-dependent catalytic subunit